MSENASSIAYFCAKYPNVVIENSINPNWYPLLNSVFEQNEENLTQLNYFLANILELVNPAKEHIWAFTRFCNPDEVKVVIIGQDPYPTPELKNSMGFSVNRPNNLIPPSLQKVLDEVQRDISNSRFAPSLRGYPPQHGCLENWARQGVVLLDAVLTVTQNNPQSHRFRGWEKIVGSIIMYLQNIAKHNGRFIIFMLWGRVAWKMKEYVNVNGDSKVLLAGDPSSDDEMNDFMGCEHFSIANEILIRAGLQPVDWSLE
ncbi:uracil-DNA glycosylase [Leptinotarsa decemlineata]|uniref:uracil-DNA glycosylase n=1 Tax=Leptinotarsa decemlineata TaxID=7539 RepID=UPI000C253837|nr:uncharacterized protein LOC111505574 [Leptinotarsa decemlineata]